MGRMPPIRCIGGFMDELYKLSPSMPRTVVTALYENIKQREAEDAKN